MSSRARPNAEAMHRGSDRRFTNLAGALLVGVLGLVGCSAPSDSASESASEEALSFLDLGTVIRRVTATDNALRAKHQASGGVGGALGACNATAQFVSGKFVRKLLCERGTIYSSG